jgi:hypothetical protein
MPYDPESYQRIYNGPSMQGKCTECGYIGPISEITEECFACVKVREMKDQKGELDGS